MSSEGLLASSYSGLLPTVQEKSFLDSSTASASYQTIGKGVKKMSTRDMLDKQLPELVNDFDGKQREAITAANAVINHLRHTADRLQRHMSGIEQDLLAQEGTVKQHPSTIIQK